MNNPTSQAFLSGSRSSHSTPKNEVLVMGLTALLPSVLSFSNMVMVPMSDGKQVPTSGLENFPRNSNIHLPNTVNDSLTWLNLHLRNKPEFLLQKTLLNDHLVARKNIETSILRWLNLSFGIPSETWVLAAPSPSIIPAFRTDLCQLLSWPRQVPSVQCRGKAFGDNTAAKQRREISDLAVY